MNVATSDQIAALLADYKAGLTAPGALENWADQATQALRTGHTTGASWIDGRDAAFPANLHGWPGLVFGYYGGPMALNVWDNSAWRAFGSYKVPIWVGGMAGAPEGQQAVAK